jgi:hypothetical protein
LQHAYIECIMIYSAKFLATTIAINTFQARII